MAAIQANCKNCMWECGDKDPPDPCHEYVESNFKFLTEHLALTERVFHALNDPAYRTAHNHAMRVMGRKP